MIKDKVNNFVLYDIVDIKKRFSAVLSAYINRGFWIQSNFSASGRNIILECINIEGNNIFIELKENNQGMVISVRTLISCEYIEKYEYYKVTKDYRAAYYVTSADAKKYIAIKKQRENNNIQQVFKYESNRLKELATNYLNKYRKNKVFSIPMQTDDAGKKHMVKLQPKDVTGMVVYQSKTIAKNILQIEYSTVDKVMSVRDRNWMCYAY